MARIYTEQNEELYKLLDKAANTSGATLVIPDLQRPFVWTPNQVTLLVDSLIRGWPFGTLLLWKVLHDEKRHMPSRGFWQVVDRTGDDEGVPLQKLALPAEYVMVLDGQQRLQSLLLATHGDGSGFKLTDKAWAVETGTKSAKGPNTRKYWSTGSLCFDIEEFLLRYREAEEQLASVEFDKVLKWAVLDAKTGRSNAKRSEAYVYPIPLRGSDSTKSKLVRFCRLWDLAGRNPAMKEKNFHEELRTLLKQHDVDPSKFQDLVTPLAELMTTLRDVKLARVTFLELSPYDSDVSSSDAYDDAIVSIFTRLNTAGRTLTREEITFAWLKVGWDDKQTGNRQATRCFDDLLEEIRSAGKVVGVDIGIDELVGAVSFLWAVAFRKGALLSNRDLLQGEIIRPMAGDLSAIWKVIEQAVTSVTELIRQRKLEYRKHYFSANALAVLWTLHFLALKRASELKLQATETDDLEKKLEAGLTEHADRWLICSGWAERWAGSSGTVLKGYATDLAEDLASFASATDVKTISDVYTGRLRILIKDLETDASAFVDTRLAVDTREQVRAYFTPLWIWHRLNQGRWNASKDPLLIGKGKSDSLDVDHSISVKIWEGKQVADGDLSEGETKESLVNSIGNCLLLRKSFNIAKKARALRAFMEEVHDVKEGKIKIEDWARELSLSDAQLDGDKATASDAAKATRDRDALLKSELKDFIRGKAKRIDV